MKRQPRCLGRELATLLAVALWTWVGAPTPAGALDCADAGLVVDPAADEDNDGFTNDLECDDLAPAFLIYVVPTGSPEEFPCESAGSGSCRTFSLAGPFTPDLFANLFPTSGDQDVCSELFPGSKSLLNIDGHDPLSVLSNGLGIAVHRDVVDPSFPLGRLVGPQSEQRLLRLLETQLDGPIGEFGSIDHGFVNDAGDGVIHTGTICRFVLGKCPTDDDCNNTANDTPQFTPDTLREIVLAQIANTVAHECGHGCPKLTRRVSRKNGPHEGEGSGRVMEKFIDVSCGTKGRPPCELGISTEYSGTDLNDATLIDAAAQ